LQSSRVQQRGQRQRQSTRQHPQRRQSPTRGRQNGRRTSTSQQSSRRQSPRRQQSGRRTTGRQQRPSRRQSPRGRGQASRRQQSGRGTIRRQSPSKGRSTKGRQQSPRTRQTTRRQQRPSRRQPRQPSKSKQPRQPSRRQSKQPKQPVKPQQPAKPSKPTPPSKPVEKPQTPPSPPSTPSGPSSISPSTLQKIIPSLKPQLAQQYAPLLAQAMKEANINTPQRQAAFIAQLGHESGGLKWFKEFASGAKYEGRKDLGNKYPGDGVRFKGRGPIQLTGRTNYEKAGKALGLDLVNNPTLAERPDVGFRTAAWFWNKNNLNKYADLGTQKGFDQVTRRVNGGYNGKADRDAYWKRANNVLKQSGGNGSSQQIAQPLTTGQRQQQPSRQQSSTNSQQQPSSSASSGTNGKYTYFNQADPKWGSISQGSSNVKKSGCLISSLAMALNTKGVKINGEPVNPGNLVKHLSERNMFTSGGGLKGGATDKLGLTRGKTYSPRDASGVAAINGGKVVLLHVQNGRPSGHWVLATASDGKTFQVQDPGHRNTHSYDVGQVIEMRQYN
ncbi:hypothetical protein AKO1_010346, partial [Acrasis kona]